ncbi:putative DNA binding domain-containing protein [bacterium]|nr:putative DNA binding domain-containing protein [bacterium]
MPERDMSTAEVIYRSIVDAPDPLQRIKQFVEEKTEESDYLEFKRYEPGNPNDPKKPIESKWAKMLSGFSNSGGGVVVWGIDTKRIEPGTLDRAHKLAPIKNAEACRNTLVKLFNRMTDPPVKGVECEFFIDEDGSGFVVSYVPNGSHKPYRSMVDTGRPFYIRAGDEFAPININVLRMLFFPERSVQWSCTIEPTLFEKNDMRMNVRFTIRLTNHGPSTAENVMLSISGNKHCLFTGYSEPFCTALTLGPNMQSWKVSFDMNPSVTAPFNCEFHGVNGRDFWTITRYGELLLSLVITVNRRDARTVSGTVDYQHFQLEQSLKIREVILTEDPKG